MRAILVISSLLVLAQARPDVSHGYRYDAPTDIYQGATPVLPGISGQQSSSSFSSQGQYQATSSGSAIPASVQQGSSVSYQTQSQQPQQDFSSSSGGSVQYQGAVPQQSLSSSYSGGQGGSYQQNQPQVAVGQSSFTSSGNGLSNTQFTSTGSDSSSIQFGVSGSGQQSGAQFGASGSGQQSSTRFGASGSGQQSSTQFGASGSGQQSSTQFGALGNGIQSNTQYSSPALSGKTQVITNTATHVSPSQTITIDQPGLNQQQSDYVAPQNLEPIITKSFYIHAAPEEPEETQAPKFIPVGRPQKNYKIIFIKAPAYGINAQTIPVVPQNEEKTIIYVLSKKPGFNQNIELPPVPTTPPTKPEVFFIKYKSEKEAQQAQQHIQGVYENNKDDDLSGENIVINNFNTGADVPASSVGTTSSQSTFNQFTSAASIVGQSKTADSSSGSDSVSGTSTSFVSGSITSGHTAQNDDDAQVDTAYTTTEQNQYQYAGAASDSFASTNVQLQSSQGSQQKTNEIEYLPPTNH